MGIWDGVKRAANSFAKPEAFSFRAGGLPVQCSHCKNEKFVQGTVVLHNWGLELFGDDATTLMCENCGLIQIYGVAPEKR